MMTGYSVETRVGNVRAGETDSLWVPQENRGKQGLILLHGSSAPEQYITVENTGAVNLAAQIASAGIPCISAEMSGQAFGNDSAMADIDAALAYLSAKTGVSSSKVHLLGVSMGGYTGLRYAALNPSRVATWTGIIPLCDLDYAYQNNVSGLRGQIGTAWGVTYPAALPAGAIISDDFPTLAAQVKTRIYYSSADLLLPVSMMTATGAALHSEVVQEVDSVSGHTDVPVRNTANIGGAKSGKTIIDFLKANGA